MGIGDAHHTCAVHQKVEAADERRSEKYGVSHESHEWDTNNTKETSE